MSPAMQTVTRRTRADLINACWAQVSGLVTFGYAEIAAGQKISHQQAACIVRDWVQAGMVAPLEREPNGTKLWKVTEASEHRVRASTRSREDNIWTAMRGLKSFGPTELAAHANTDTVAVAVDEAQAYCRALLASGHLSVARKAIPGIKEAIYRIARNTGPRAPREKRVRAVIDDNTNAVVVISGVAR